VTDVAGLARLEDEWTTLFDRISGALPFASHAWTVAWWTHLRRKRPWMADALRVYVIRAADGRVIAIAPFMLTTYRALGLPLIRVLQAIGADPNITEVRGMLVGEAEELEAVEALQRHLRSSRFSVDWIRWTGLRRNGDAFARLAASSSPARELSTFVLSLPASWEEFRKSRPRNIRESLRKCYNSLARDGHEWQFEALDSRSDILSSLDRFFDLHGGRAQAATNIVHPNYFATQSARSFLKEVVDSLGRRGVARMFQLSIGGEIVAMRLGFRFGDSLYLYYSGYDPEWGRYSVMTTVVAETLRYATECGIKFVNLSSGSDVSKTRWRPDEIAYADVDELSPGARARLAHRAISAAVARKARRRVAAQVDSTDA
jgi:CelD/BcsL family acetyltransferase involved in cellulose biosynthesis